MLNDTESILNQLKLLIFDSGIDRDILDYGVIPVSKDSSTVRYYIHLKDNDVRIIDATTRSEYIMSTDAERAMKKLKAVVNLMKFDSLKDLESLSIYNATHFTLYGRVFIHLKDTNVLFFPNELELVLIKKARIISEELDSVVESCHRKKVTPETFDISLEELKILEKKRAKDLFEIDDEF